MPRPFTFMHAADLHLDAPFAGVTAEHGEVGEALARATYEAFGRVVEECVRLKADFLVIAGDAYNSRDRSLRAQLRFQEAMRRLAEAGVEVFVAQGNHDPASGWSANLAMPESVRVFPTDRVGRYEVVRDGEVVCAVYGRSFAKAAETSNLAEGYRREGTEPFALGVLHANVGGDTDHEPYAPCSLRDLRDAGMDYWALGHIHKPEVLAESPHVAYAGSPQGLNPKERGRHGCWLVTVSEGGRLEEPEFLETSAVVWDGADVDVGDCPDIEALLARLHEGCERMREDAGRPVIARFDLTGRSPVHADLRKGGAAADLLEALRDEQMSRDPWLWVDRLRDRTSPPFDLEAVGAGRDFAADVVRVAADLLADPPAADALLAEVTAPLRAVPGLHDVSEMSSAEMLARARDLCLDRLLAEEEAG